jgi:hypothetical protein
VARVERRTDNPIVDLDQVADVIDGRRLGWSEVGLDVGPCTWMDQDAPWPVSLVIDRAAIKTPRSVGVVIRKGEEAEAVLVVYAGGWADADYVRLNEDEGMTTEYVEIDDMTAIEQLLDRISLHLNPS